MTEIHQAAQPLMTRLEALEYATDFLPEQHRTGNQLLNVAKWLLGDQSKVAPAPSITLNTVLADPEPEPMPEWEKELLAPAHDFKVGDRVYHTVFKEHGTVAGTEVDSDGQITVLEDRFKGNGHTFGSGRLLKNLVRPEPKAGDRIRKITEEQSLHSDDAIDHYDTTDAAPKGAMGKVYRVDDDGDLVVGWDENDHAYGSFILPSQVAVVESE